MQERRRIRSTAASSSQFPADGAYRVSVTSFRSGETGAYRLQAVAPAADVAVTAPRAGRADPRSAPTVNGRLAAGDGRLGSGEYSDRYRFSARRGQRVRDRAHRRQDRHLSDARAAPTAPQDANDDTEVDGETSINSRIDTVLAEDGDYVIVATSYRAERDRRLSAEPRAEPGPAAPDRRAGRAAGDRACWSASPIMAGGPTTCPIPTTTRASSTTACAAPACSIPASPRADQRGGDDQDVADAFARAAAAAGPNDIFLFFFSGHGDQVDVPVERRRAGRARRDDRAVRRGDDRRRSSRRCSRSVRGRMSMVAIDACYAGGFRNLVNRPNVMGLFSSEEDLTSLVADRFKAGGFLSYFLRAGLAGEADDDGDRIVTAGELSTYVRRRFRREGDIPATTREDEHNFQNLLVERGGVHIDDVVVRLAGGPQVAAVPPQRPAPVQLDPERDADAGQAQDESSGSPLRERARHASVADVLGLALALGRGEFLELLLGHRIRPSGARRP